jgi:hypothetical protein
VTGERVGPNTATAQNKMPVKKSIQLAKANSMQMVTYATNDNSIGEQNHQ